MNMYSLSIEEEERLRLLRSYQIIDTGSEKDFDSIVELACEICNTPIGFISLIDDKKQWFKASKGLNFSEVSKDFSICQFTITNKCELIVDDLSLDDRFAKHPMVINDPKIRFYAGIPLQVGGNYNLGTMCIADIKPKEITEHEIENLRKLARQVVNLLSLRLSNLKMLQLVQSKNSEMVHLFDRIGDAFLSLDKDWRYVYVNKQLGDLIRRDPHTLIGKNVWEEFPDAVNSATYIAFHQAMKEQKYICHVDYYGPLNLWQENHIYPSPDGLTVFIRNISERKRAEQKLVESIETLERAEEQAKMGSWHLELSTGKRYWSRQLYLMFGFDPDGKMPTADELLERIHPEDRQLMISSVEKMRQGIEPGELIIRTNPMILSLKYIMGYARSVKNEQGIITRFEGTMIDVTELQKTNRELDHFVYSVSHDLRAPLTTILGLIDLAEMEPSSQINYMKIIRDQVNRLDYFIKEILDYSANARTEVRKERIDFDELIKQMKERIQPLTQKQRIDVRLHVSGEFTCFADRSRLEIIFNNLYSNSIKYQDPQKDFCLVEITITLREHETTINYSDNGLGIEKKHLDKIFNMFYRASEKASGSGLGLYITKEAVAKLGGNISVASIVGKGTQFEIIIPNH